jgi:hypothetical protein
MTHLAEVLSNDIPFVRVDFYEIEGRPYFGELTVFPVCGFEESFPKAGITLWEIGWKPPCKSEACFLINK